MNNLSPTTLLFALAAFTLALIAEPLSATPNVALQEVALQDVALQDVALQEVALQEEALQEGALQEAMTEPAGRAIDTTAALKQTLDHRLAVRTPHPDFTEVTTEVDAAPETKAGAETVAEAGVETGTEADAEAEGEAESETRAKQDNDISLITDTPQEGFQLAIRLSRLGVTETQPNRDVLFGLRDAYATDPDALIASSQVIAIHFQTIAAANNYWRE